MLSKSPRGRATPMGAGRVMGIPVLHWPYGHSTAMVRHGTPRQGKPRVAVAHVPGSWADGASGVGLRRASACPQALAGGEGPARPWPARHGAGVARQPAYRHASTHQKASALPLGPQAGGLPLPLGHVEGERGRAAVLAPRRRPWATKSRRPWSANAATAGRGAGVGAGARSGVPPHPRGPIGCLASSSIVMGCRH